MLLTGVVERVGLERTVCEIEGGGEGGGGSSQQLTYRRPVHEAGGCHGVLLQLWIDVW